MAGSLCASSWELLFSALTGKNSTALSQMQRTLFRVKVLGSAIRAAVFAAVGFGGWYGWQSFADASARRISGEL